MAGLRAAQERTPTALVLQEDPPQACPSIALFFQLPSLSPVLLCPPHIISPRSLTPTMVGTWAASVAESQSG